MNATAFRSSRMVRYGLAATSSTVLVLAFAIGTVLAWTAPSLQALCAADENHYSWEINLTHEPDYLIQFSWSSTFSNPWTVNFASSGSHDFDTDRGGSTLYARWKNDTAKKTSAAADSELCEQPSPTPEESVKESVSESPSPTPQESVSETPSPTPEESVSETPSPTPEQSIAGSTGTPAPSIPNTALGISGQGAALTLSLPLAVFLGGLLIAGLMMLARGRVR